MKRPIDFFGYETIDDPVIPVRRFFRRVGINIAVALALIGVSLGVGMLGYHTLERVDWLDSFLAASMILSGMGPVAPLIHPATKLFAGIYALYSGLMLVATASLIIAPVLHRVMHRLHVRMEADDGA